ncbi:MAG: hypothetical protein KBT02_02810 [Treponema sp.]|nr:hypothetical protein [Candidatus Treponema caballi]
MFNLKLTVISAILGLLFSLLLGMINQVSFGILILRGFISAVLTGGIAAAASFVFKKFLADDAVTMAVSQNTSSTGNIVDITLKVDEDVLPDAENAPPFYVSPESMKVQKPVDIYKAAAKKTATAQTSAETIKEPAVEKTASVVPEPKNEINEGFKPQPLVSEKTPQYSVIPDTSSKTEDVSEDNTKKITDISGSSSGLEGLDELPDLSDVVAGDSEDVADIISDSDFATASAPSANYSASAGSKEVDVGNDASLMADTIRTLLKSEG